MNERQLGKITALLAELGLEVTYAYDDLVFVQHSAFLFQFTDIATLLKLFTNNECNPVEAQEVIATLIAEFDKAGFTVTPSGCFTLSANEDQTLNIQFQ